MTRLLHRRARTDGEDKIKWYAGFTRSSAAHSPLNLEHITGLHFVGVKLMSIAGSIMFALYPELPLTEYADECIWDRHGYGGTLRERERKGVSFLTKKLRSLKIHLFP